MGAPAASLTTAVIVAGCEALTVLLLNARINEPAVLEVTLVVDVEPEPEPLPVLLPLDPLPNAELPDTL